MDSKRLSSLLRRGLGGFAFSGCRASDLRNWGFGLRTVAQG